MEDWEAKHISKNLPDLLVTTIWNDCLSARLLAKGILSTSEVEGIESKIFRYEQAALLYSIIVTRKNSYTHLISALQESKQYGAVAILNKIVKPEILWTSLIDPIWYDRSAPLGCGSSGSYVYFGKFGTNKTAVKVIYVRDIPKEDLKYKLKSLINCKSHENVARYIAYREDPEVRQILLATELCDTTLKEYVENKGNIILPARISQLETMIQATKGLSYLHKQNIIHLDLKPSNILLVKKHDSVVVKVADFGISNWMDKERSSVTLTVTLGSECWQAPEVLDHLDWKEKCRKTQTRDTPIKTIDFSSDIFALGCVFYYVVSGGDHPFGVTRREITKNIDCDALVMDRKYDNPVGICLLVRQMVARNTANRPTASDIFTHSIFCKAENLQFLT